MIYKQSITLFLTLIFLTVACKSTSPVSNFPTIAAVQEAIFTPTVSAPGLTVEQLKNAQYQLGARDDYAIVQLTDGIYQEGTGATTLDYAYIALTDFVAMGDLSGDGVDEAAAIFFENYGGTGNFSFLAIYKNVNGLPVFLTSTFIDDRPIINSIKIENGEVYLDAIIHGHEDPGCCPQLPTTRRYALVNNQLRLTNYSSTTPVGTTRVVEITSPANLTEATDSVQVSGTVSIAPFENTLTHSIFNEAGDELGAGPVTVIAPDLGVPGTFNEVISLADIPLGTTIYLDIKDLSAADGSILALDSIKLLVK
jgi:hypothetical protein